MIQVGTFALCNENDLVKHFDFAFVKKHRQIGRFYGYSYLFMHAVIRGPSANFTEGPDLAASVLGLALIQEFEAPFGVYSI